MRLQVKLWLTCSALILSAASGCASSSKVKTPTRPWLVARAGSLQQANVEAFGVKYIVRANTPASLNAAVTEIKRLSDLADTNNSSSDISQLNSKAYEKAVVVSPDMVNLLALCESMYQISDHKFDVTFVPYQINGNFSETDFNAITDWDKKEKLSPNTLRYFGKQNVLVDPSTRQVRIYNRRTKLNLNGMVRGFAVSKAIEAMTRTGATGGSVIAENMVSAMGTELKNPSLFCVENPVKLGTCLYHIVPANLTHPLFVGTSASKERRGVIFDPKDTWSYRDGGVTVAGQNGAWVQFAATLTSLMDDGQLETFLKKNFSPKVAAVYFDQSKTTQIKGTLLPFAKLAR